MNANAEKQMKCVIFKGKKREALAEGNKIKLKCNATLSVKCLIEAKVYDQITEHLQSLSYFLNAPIMSGFGLAMSYIFFVSIAPPPSLSFQITTWVLSQKIIQGIQKSYQITLIGG